MLLRERQRIKNQTIFTKLKSNNLDLQLINSLAKNKQGLSLQQKQTPANNIADLSKQLREKNNKFSTNRQNKIKTADWLAQKGINLKQVYQEIRKNQIAVIDLPPQLKEEQARQKSKPQQKQLDFTINNQLDYIKSHKQLVVYSIMQITMNNIKKLNRSNAVLARLKIIDHLHGKWEKNNERKTKELQIDPIQEQKMYSDIVKLHINQGDLKTICNSFATSFKNTKQFWSIIECHVNTINQSQENLCSQKDRDQLNIQLMLDSLKMVQKIFDKKLPSNRNQIETLFKKTYQKSGKRINLYYNQRGIPSWGIGYLLYRAGRVKDFYQQCLSQAKMLKLRQQFVSYDQAVQNRAPFFSTVGFFSQVSDDFYDQLQYILRGESKFVSSIVLDYDSLQTVWVILRTLGIYRNISGVNQNQYQQILNSLFLKYEKSPMTKEELHNILYLGGYRNIVQLYNNQKFQQIKNIYNNGQGPLTYNDYFHLLLIVYLNQQLWSQIRQNQSSMHIKKLFEQKQQKRIQEKSQKMKQFFEENLMNYLFYLKNQSQYCQYYVSYLMLMSNQSMIKYATQLIKTESDFTKFNWKEFKQKLQNIYGKDKGESIYSQFTTQILTNFRPKTFLDFKFIANQFKNILHNQQKQIQFLVQLITKNQYYSQEEGFYDFISMNRFYKSRNNFNCQQYLTFLGLNEESTLNSHFNNNIAYNNDRNYKQTILEIKKIWQKLQKYFKDQKQQTETVRAGNSYKKYHQKRQGSTFEILKDVFEFIKEIILITNLLQQKNSQKLTKYQPKFICYSSEINKNLKNVLLYLSNKKIFEVYIFYLKEQIRRAEILSQQYYRKITYSYMQILKSIQKIEESNIWLANQNDIRTSHSANQLKRYLSQRIDDDF